MGFLDKLLGRGKEATADAESTSRETGDKAADAGREAGDKGQETFDEAKSRVSGGDEGSSGPGPGQSQG